MNFKGIWPYDTGSQLTRSPQRDGLAVYERILAFPNFHAYGYRGIKKNAPDLDTPGVFSIYNYIDT